MAFAVTSTVERRLGPTRLKDTGTSTGACYRYTPTQIYLPWEGQHREVSAEERQPLICYRKVLLDRIEFG